MTKTRTFDGVICFGGSDWWYHNRGHYDLQMCRFLRKSVPVLYVNSIGVRAPSIREGGMFVRRVVRKAHSWGRGFVQLDESFGVVSPFSVPGPIGSRLAGRVLVRQVQRAAKKLGIRMPLLWIECPTAEQYLSRIPHFGLVYQRTDRYEEFPRVNVERIRSHDARLKARADLTVFCSSLLFEQEGTACHASRFIDHGVDVDRFVRAGESDQLSDQPADMRSILRPRVGFVGGIDDHTFDPELFNEVVRICPDLQFVLVGACSLPEGWCISPNVHFLGQRSYERVASYMAACDVLIMPWNSSEWIKACNPVKLKEYLAVGRPIVSTPFHELKRYEEEVMVATDAQEFAAAIRAAIANPGDASARRNLVCDHSWEVKGNDVLAVLRQTGLSMKERDFAVEISDAVGSTADLEAT